jgi:adenylate cyclase class IV
MIEVEIRGELTKEQHSLLDKKFGIEGKLIEVQDREMVRLFGFSEDEDDIIKRSLDVRVRVTNGHSEIMVKTNITGDNLARREQSFDLGEMDLEEVKSLVKVFGFCEGRWMHRKKKVYMVDGCEWSLVEAVPDIYYFEVEKVAESEEEISNTKEQILNQIHKFNLKSFSDEEYSKFISTLNEKVNKVLTW